ncbi:hypothetical protein RDWZM_001035 [Blomia tropicalis]|uniref:Protein NDRG3 n=1 Tax=Blomia tropicalis TaxID=40697 RepID=A0A9Q0RQC8_BLOTA|nr:Protein ndrg3 [Blomia tropicalis]KAJ6222490.1 hypothetical protein RDWZM_001035 [Blomia tropicalis]
MPIYYKKVNPDSNDMGLIESGLGSSGSPSCNNSTGFFNGVQKKVMNFGGRSTTNNEVELEKISCSFMVDDDHLEDLHLGDGPKTKTFLLKSKTMNEDRDRLMTKFGPITIVKQSPKAKQESETHKSIPLEGEPKDARIPRPVIITYHDIGMNYFSNFESFFTRMNVTTLLQDFTIFHVNAPGQEENADDLPHVGYVFPTMDDLAEQLLEVCRHYNIMEFIGFGYGAGCNVLSRFALSNSDMVEALFLINPSATTSTWAEWFYQKLNIRTLTQLNAATTTNGQTLPITGSSNSGPDLTLPQSLQDYFIWHLFGNISLPDRILDEEALTFYQRYFDSGSINRHNLSMFIESYIGRTALGITRDDKLNNFKCPVAVVCGDYSPHVDESVKMNSRLDPTNSTWMKLGDCSMVLEEQPNKVSEVLRLFLQGLGYTLKRALKNEKSFITGKSMPCLAYYTKQNEKIAELRRGTTFSMNEV